VLSTFAGIDSLAVNGLILPIEAFTVPFDHFVLILFLQREANYKCDNTDNNENAIEVCQELTIQASATGVIGVKYPRYRGLLVTAQMFWI
jgi:hypothetical protein